jgi:hypothetical protein
MPAWKRKSRTCSSRKGSLSQSGTVRITLLFIPNEVMAEVVVLHPLQLADKVLTDNK